MRTRPYGQGALFRFVLQTYEAAGGDYLTGATITDGDAKYLTDRLEGGFANLSAESRAFTSGSEEPNVGDTLVGATSTETCVYIGSVVTSGTWGAGTAAGIIFVEQLSGAFQSENIDISGGTANVLTIGGDFSLPPLEEIGEGAYAVAFTSSEMECADGECQIKDQTDPKEWNDTSFEFETEPPLPHSGTIVSATATTATLPSSAAGLKNMVIYCYHGTGAPQSSPIVSTSGSVATVPGWENATPDATTKYVVVPDAVAIFKHIIENGLTFEEVLRLMLSADVGLLSGAATTNVKIRDTADSKDRIDATVDEDGNRTAVTLDGS